MRVSSALSKMCCQKQWTKQAWTHTWEQCFHDNNSFLVLLLIWRTPISGWKMLCSNYICGFCDGKCQNDLGLGFCFYLSRGFWADGRSLGSTAGPGTRLQGSPRCPPEYLCSRCCHLHRPPLPLHLCPPPPLSHHHLPPHRPRHCSDAWVAPMYPGNADVSVIIAVIFIVTIVIVTITCLQVLPCLCLSPGHPALPWFPGHCSQGLQSRCSWRFCWWDPGVPRPLGTPECLPDYLWSTERQKEKDRLRTILCDNKCAVRYGRTEYWLWTSVYYCHWEIHLREQFEHGQTYWVDLLSVRKVIYNWNHGTKHNSHVSFSPSEGTGSTGRGRDPVEKMSCHMLSNAIAYERTSSQPTSPSLSSLETILSNTPLSSSS